ncbi:MAG: HD domain-containing protein [Nitrospirae bacterium]|nr:HD domain-containing protein [Nitrospirota bacterium]
MEVLKNDARARLYIEGADKYLETIGYTEHGFRHAAKVADTAYYILKELGYPEGDAQLVAMSGYLHDIGNILGRGNHDQLSAILSKEILEKLGMDMGDTIKVMSAIGIHENEDGEIPGPIAAALLIADKADVHRSRVRSPAMVSSDIHDRVNYAATESVLTVDPEAKTITLTLAIDTKISQVIEYFEIFLSRMSICRKAARALACEFQLYINNTRMA